MVNQRGGVGGYGAIWTLNQDQRQGRYHPHPSISKRRDYMEDFIYVKCMKCKAEWRHPTHSPWGPPQCKPEQGEGYDE